MAASSPVVRWKWVLYLCTWAVSFRRWPNLLDQGGTFLTGTQSFLFFLSISKPMSSCACLKYVLMFLAFPGGWLQEESASFYLSFGRSLPLPHPPLLGEADISANDRYLIICSEWCYFFSSSFFGVVGGSWVVLDFPPVFLKVAERVRVARAEARGTGRSPVGLG